ncbi:MAG TPA: type II secretion system protein GspD, partial [Pseudomonas sp.]|nr:type II secretion system protein GspD [Pseudomonas sp.]
MSMQFRKQRLALALALGLGALSGPLAAQTAGAAADGEDLVLNLRDADINGLIEIVSQETGINFIVDPRVRGEVNVVSGQPIRRDELYDIFLSVLKSQGFAAVRGSDGLVRIVPEVQAKENEVATLGDNTPGDEYITEVLTVNNMDAGQLVRILRPLVPKGGHLAAAAQSNSLVIADTAANVRRIKSLISRIDRESMEDFEVLPLQHASALDVVRIVQGLDSNAPAEEFARGPKLIADERTNSVILRGDPEARAGLRAVVRQLDVAGNQGNTQVHYLRYAKAEEVAEVLRGIAEGRERN